LSGHIKRAFSDCRKNEFQLVKGVVNTKIGGNHIHQPIFGQYTNQIDHCLIETPEMLKRFAAYQLNDERVATQYQDELEVEFQGVLLGPLGMEMERSSYLKSSRKHHRIYSCVQKFSNKHNFDHNFFVLQSFGFKFSGNLYTHYD
jgi:hypothetical protein